MAKEEAKEQTKECNCGDWDKQDWKNKYWMKRHHHRGRAAGGGAVYGLGLIGAVVYFWQHANTFWDVVMGLLKAIVWPALVLYHIVGLFKL